MSVAGGTDASRLQALLAVGRAVTYAITVGAHPTFTFISDNLPERFGMTPDDLCGDPNAWYARVPDDSRREILDALALARPGHPASAEYRLLLPDGQWRWVLDERVALPSPSGAVVEIAGTWTDITDRRARQEADDDPGFVANAVVDSIPALVAYVDADQRYVFANQAYVEWFGWTTDTIRGVTVREVLGEARYEWSRSYIEGALRGEYADFEGEAPNRGSGIRYARVMYGPRMAADGAIVGYYVVVTDLTTLTRAHEALRANEGRLTAIIETAADGIVTATEDGVIESLNPAAREMFRLAPGQGVGENITVLMPPEESREHAGAMRRYIEEGEARVVGVGRVVRGRRTDGSVFPLHISLSDAPLPDGRRFTAIMRDMTEETRLANELRALTAELERRVADRTAALEREAKDRQAAEDELRHVLAGARCILWRATVQDVEGDMQWNVTPLDNDAAQRFVPLLVSDGTPWHTASIDARFPEDNRRMVEFVHGELRAGSSAYSQEFRVTDARGDMRWLQEDVLVEPTGASSWYLVGVLTDVTARKHAEEELRRSEEHFRRVFDESPVGVVIVDTGKSLVDVNPALCAMLGYSRADLVGLTIADLTHADDLALSEQALAHVAESATGMSRVEKRYRRNDGSTMWAQVTVAQLHDATSAVVGHVGMIEDIGERRRAESLRAALHEISEAVHVSADLVELVRRIGACVGGVMEAQDFAVGLTDETGEAIVRWINRWSDHPVEPEELARTRSGWVLRELRALRLTRADTLRHIKAGDLVLGDTDVGSWCGAPLVVDGKAIGVVRVRADALPTAYDDDDRDFLDFIASQIALALSRKRAEGELMQERRLFDQLMENAPESIYFKDADSRIVRVSERDATRIGASSAREVVGKTDFDFWPPRDAQRLREEEKALMRSGEPMVDRVTRHRNPDGADVWWSATKIPLMDSDGAATGIIGIGRDVTPLMATQEALRASEAQRTRVMQQLLVVQEEERARIARELHDQVGQDLASVLIGLRVIEAAGEVTSARDEAALLRERTAATLEDVRQLAFDMRPSSLDDLGLMVALERVLSSLAQESGFEPAMHVHGAPSQQLAPDVELGIYRVVHAAIANAALHAKPTTVSVVTRFTEDAVSILVEDDGRGFDVERVLSGPVEERFGLLAMQERAQMFQGELTIDSTPGEGTVVILDVESPA